MNLRMELDAGSYEIILERGSLKMAGHLFDLNRKVMIVTGELVPRVYSETLARQCSEPFIHTVPQGEASKSFPVLEELLRRCLKLDLQDMTVSAQSVGAPSAIWQDLRHRAI